MVPRSISRRKAAKQAVGAMAGTLSGATLLGATIGQLFCSTPALAAKHESLNETLQVLRLGVLPTASVRILATQYEPLQTHLSQQLKMKAVLSTAADWSGFYQGLKMGQYDLITASAHVTRLAQVETGLIPIASFNPKVRGIFIASKRANVNDIAALIRGRQIALANPASLIAFQAEQWLNTTFGTKAGLDFSFGRVRGADNVAPSIVIGDSVAGIMCRSEFMLQPDSIKQQLQVVYSFEEQPGFILSSTKASFDLMGPRIKSAIEGFSDSSALGKTFFERSGLKLLAQVNQTELSAMDIYLEKMRKLLS
jgi:phosphonate transport system substrate-binding protein